MASVLDALYYKAYKRSELEVPLEKYLLNNDIDKFFPTLRSLAQLQPQRQMRKDDLFSSEKFQDADNYVRSIRPQCSEDWTNKSWPDLVLESQLFRHSGTLDLAKVRAAFCFACNHQELPRAKKESDAYRTIRTRRCSDIFENLLRCAGVHHVKIQGFKKSADRETGWRFESPNGVWFACVVDGEWRFVDPDWGATSVRNFSTGMWIEPGEMSSRRSAGTRELGCNEFFFLTDPEKLIVSHFPDPERPVVSRFPEETSSKREPAEPAEGKDWQLLVRPLTKDEFEQMPHYFDGSEYAMGLCYQVEPLNYPKNVILAGPGPVEILFRVPELSELDFDVKVSTSNGRAENDEIGQGSLLQKVRVDRVDTEKVRLTFDPPCAGKFKLVVRLRRSQRSQSWARFLTYIVHCPGAEEVSPTPTPTPTPTPKPTPTPPDVKPEVPVVPTPLPRHPLEVSRKSLAVLRSYARPPAAAFNAVRAILLMLGFYEKRSRKWHRCQHLITAIPQAVNDLVLTSVNPRIAAKSREILDVSEETEATLAQHSDAALAFYRWVEQTTRDIRDVTPADPASIEQQKKILRVTLEEDVHWDWEDKRTRGDLARQFLGFCEICYVAVYSNDLKKHLHRCVSGSSNNGWQSARV